MKEYIYVFLMFLLLLLFSEYQLMYVEGFETSWFFDSNWWLNTPTGFKWTFGLTCGLIAVSILFLQR
jgi:hypothetical protein